MDGSNVNYVPHKEIFIERSPRSPLSKQSPPLSTLSPDSDSLDRAFDGVLNNSIEQLYDNICEMQSSDQSPSRHSFLSYGEESRIDSELRFLAGAVDVKNEESEGVKDEVLETIKGSLGRKNLNERPPNEKKKKSAKILKKSSGEAGYLGPYLLKKAREILVSGDNNNSNDSSKINSQKALDLALRAMRFFEISGNKKPNLDFVMCLHVVAALHCRFGRYTEAISVLEKSIEIPDINLGNNHAIAKFAGCMQLGDTYSILGENENSIMFYTLGLEIQRKVLGEKNSKFGETCRYLAEAYVQAMRFDEAEKLCVMALNIHEENEKSGFSETEDRRLLGFIFYCKGEYEGSIEHYVRARMVLADSKQNSEVAEIECNIGEAYKSLARYDEAILAYEKAINLFKSSKGENRSSIALVLVRLADLYFEIGKFSEAKSFCEKALRIYANPIPSGHSEEIGSGLIEISAIYESMNEPAKAVELLHKAIKVYGDAPGYISIIAAIEGQIGVLYYILGKYLESYDSLKNSISKFRVTGEEKTVFFGFTLNQLGLVCLQLLLINEAADSFEEAGGILETAFGSCYADTLGVFSNLAGAYDAMGRTADAIEILEYVVEMREEKLGTGNTDERRRLNELLNETRIVGR